MSRAKALSVSIALCLAFAGCVIVSSTTNTPPATDAGFDAAPPVERDANLPDAASRPAMTREEATRGLLASIGANVARPTYEALATEAAALEAATQAYASSGSDADRAAAREAWANVMVQVERAELLQFGPAGMAVPEILGGQGLRDRIYSFPVNRCLLNVVVERGTYEDLAALAAEPAFARGLGGVEYLLFVEDLEHGCDPGAATRVDDAAWAALGADGIRTRRAASAHASARLVREAADALVAAWSSAGGDFAGQLANAGQSGSVYPTTQAALNAVFWAMYYADRAIKDMKLAVPTGISELCGQDACPGLLESRYAGRSVEHLAENLRGLQALYRGGTDDASRVGFDDLLRAIDQDTLALELDVAIAAALARAEAIPSVDESSFAEHEAELEDLHRAVQAMVTLLKVDFAGVLAFTPPPGAGEDND